MGSVRRQPSVRMEQHHYVSDGLRHAHFHLAVARSSDQYMAAKLHGDLPGIIAAAPINYDEFNHFRIEHCAADGFRESHRFVECWYNDGNGLRQRSSRSVAAERFFAPEH